jgi:hypothetical protein
MDRTDSKIDTPVARASSWIVRDNDDNPWGPFASAGAAVEWAKKKWPEIPQYEEETFDGHGCWDVEALWSPTE